MLPWKTRLTHAALDTLLYSGSCRLLARNWAGVGVIFTLHHIRRNNESRAFAPNRILEITQGFLDQTISQVRDAGYDIVTLDEACLRLRERRLERRFACFTLDDGYADNYDNALPVFSRHQVPFTVYVTSGFPDHTAILWWRHLEEAIFAHDKVRVRMPDATLHFTTRSVSEKYRAFNAIYWSMRALDHAQQQQVICDLIEDFGFDAKSLCRRMAMTWDRIAELAACGWCTIGAHTVHHFTLSKLPAEQVKEEVTAGRDAITRQLGQRPRHFAYPYGDATSAGKREFELLEQLDFDSATTTRKGVLFPEHAEHLHALPRVSLNGDYQSQRFVRAFLSGAPFALHQRFRRLDVT